MILFFAAAVTFFALWPHFGVPIEYIGLLLALCRRRAVGDAVRRRHCRPGRRRPVLLVSTCGVGFGFLLLYLVHGAAAVAAALIIIGVFESVLHPTASTVIADVVPAETRREHFAARRVVLELPAAWPGLGCAVGATFARPCFSGAGVREAILVGALIVAIFLVETARPPPRRARW